MDKCDFCSNSEIVRRYQCMDFTSDSGEVGVVYDGTQAGPEPTRIALNSRSYWAACAACASFIDAEDIHGLLNHVTTTLIDVDPRGLSGERRVGLIRHLRHTYELFFRNRIRVAEEA